MKLILVRHGNPNFNTHMWVRGRFVEESLLQYRDARVTNGPERKLSLEAAQASHYFISSELPRAQDSLKLYANVEGEVSELLNETSLPYPNNLLIPCRWSILIVLFRVAWLFGYRSNADGIRSDMKRAERAADLLGQRALEHDTVYAFGHGVMNRLIARVLKKRGWKIESKSGDGYWSQTMMFLMRGDGE